jgi:DNA invertase Pin-like site-specific DNA recombinase
MMGETNTKVQARHLKRNAYLYVRQSTLRQVLENTESTQRQYALRERAMALGWRLDQVVIIDSDLGQSGASAVDREGFQRLVSDVGLGRAGIVMGLEVSRLARNSTDWHRLLEICALADTLILDEDGVYDPAYFNDRLLLGMKGIMSEAELHILRARLRGGILNKARRGDLEIRLPVGFDYDPAGRVRLDPDVRVQESVRQFFRTFRRTGSATATVKAFRTEGLMFPHRIYRGIQAGELVWTELEHSRALWLLHHPRYTGAFCFGRTRTRKLPNGSLQHQRLPTEEWIALIRDAHAGYITWDEYEQNLQILRDNTQAPASGREQGPAREGPALLQGLVICAKCGDRMTVRYHQQGRRRVPDYVCQRHGIRHAEPICHQIVGGELDAAIGKLLVDAVTPVTLEVAMAVQKELDNRSAESDQLRHQAVERARYESDLARRRYMRCDPDNRLVADSLEAEWNLALRAQTAAQVRFNGGATHTLHLLLPKPAWLLRQTSATVVAEIDRLLEEHTDGEIANLLNNRSLLSGDGKPFHRLIVRNIRLAYSLSSRHDRLRSRGFITLAELAQRLNVSTATIKYWRRASLLKAHKYDDRNDYLFELPGDDTPIKHQHQGKTTGRSSPVAATLSANTI